MKRELIELICSNEKQPKSVSNPLPLIRHINCSLITKHLWDGHPDGLGKSLPLGRSGVVVKEPGWPVSTFGEWCCNFDNDGNRVGREYIHRVPIDQ